MGKETAHTLYGPPGIGEGLGHLMGPIIARLGGIFGSNSSSTEIHAIFLDYDGTLLTHDHRILPSTLGYIRKAIDKGIDIISISGRAPASITPFISEMGIQDPIYIAHHGARIERDGEVIPYGNNPLPQESAKSLMEVFDSLGLEGRATILYFHGNIVPHRITDSTMFGEYRERNPHLKYFQLRKDATIKDFLGPGLPDKVILLVDTPELAKDLKKELEQKLKEPLSIMISNDTYIECVGRGVTKGKAVKTVLDYLRGMDPGRAIAFGDGESDLTIPEQAGVYLYLMGNAPGHLKNKVKGSRKVKVLPHTNMEDAIGRVIAEVILKEPYIE